MKLAILGDTHFGVRNDSMAFHNYAIKFYEKVFFPYLHDNGIQNVIQVGDLFDRRKFINYQTLYLSKIYFFNKFKSNLHLYTFPGNHDVFFKNTLSVNSIEQTLSSYILEGFIKIFTKPTTIDFGRTSVDFIPWICQDNEQEIADFMKKTKSQICFGHFEIEGFEMDKDNVCENGLLRREFDMYDMVISGHFHQKSSDGHIFYVGAPMEHTWSDYNQERGFHVFDTETRLLTFIPNPYKMHELITYNDSGETLESITGKDYKPYNQLYLKVVVEEKKNPVLFDAFMNEIYKVDPLDVNIVENFMEDEEEIDIDQSEDTITIVNKCIDNIETNLDKNKLKSLMYDMYKASVQVMEIE